MPFLKIIFEFLMSDKAHNKRDNLGAVNAILLCACIYLIQGMKVDIATVGTKIALVEASVVEINSALYWKMNINPHAPHNDQSKIPVDKSATIAETFINPRREY